MIGSIQAHGRSEIGRVLQLSGKEILTVGNDSRVKVWDCSSRTLLRERVLNSQYLVCASLTSQGIAVGSASGHVLLLHPNLEIK
jgi:hypothetical protein